MSPDFRATNPGAFGRVEAAARVAVEPLEGRLLFAAITVTTAADTLAPNDGSVSLREAITAINAGNDLGDPDITAQNPGTFGTNDTINFNIPGAGVKTINVGTDASASGIALPTITKPVTINGYTPDRGDAQHPCQRRQRRAPDRAERHRRRGGVGRADPRRRQRRQHASGAWSINRFTGDGIVVESDGNTIAGNFVGVDPTGTTRMPNGTFPGSGDGIRDRVRLEQHDRRHRRRPNGTSSQATRSTASTSSAR